MSGPSESYLTSAVQAGVYNALALAGEGWATWSMIGVSDFTVATLLENRVVKVDVASKVTGSTTFFMVF